MVAAVLTTTVAACGSSGSSGASAPAAGTSAAVSAATSGAGATTGVTLRVAKTSLGSIVVGPNDRTVYMFGKDVKGSGKSSCAGQCLGYWPPVTVTGSPKTTGISGKIGTITTDGKKQLTLAGWPLYYFVGDSSAGDVKGQGNKGFGGVWQALMPNGAEVTGSGGAAGSGGGGGKGGYGSY